MVPVAPQVQNVFSQKFTAGRGGRRGEAGDRSSSSLQLSRADSRCLLVRPAFGPAALLGPARRVSSVTRVSFRATLLRVTSICTTSIAAAAGPPTTRSLCKFTPVRQSVLSTRRICCCIPHASCSANISLFSKSHPPNGLCFQRRNYYSPSADLQYRAADFGAQRAALIDVQRDTACFVM